MHRYLYLFGSNIQWYEILNILSFFPALIFNLCCFKQKRDNLSVLSGRVQEKFFKKLKNTSRFRFLEKKTFWTAVEIVLITAIQIIPTAVLNKVCGRIFGTGSNYFGFLFVIPVILTIVYWFAGIDPIKQSDLITPAFPLSLIFIKLACFCEGCCSGIESLHFSMYNHYTKHMEVPVQLIEAGWGLLLFVILFAIRKKVKPGTLYPLYTILYSATRFFSEFLRHEDNILGPLKKYHLLCIVGIIIGIIQYIVVTKYGEQIRAFIQPGCIDLIAKLKEKLAKQKKAKQKAKKKNKKKNKNKKRA